MREKIEKYYLKVLAGKKNGFSVWGFKIFIWGLSLILFGGDPVAVSSLSPKDIPLQISYSLGYQCGEYYIGRDW